MPETFTSTKSKFTLLETVYPPISNQEAAWLEKDQEVEELLRQSDFYMIGGRAEAKYLNLVIDSETYIATFDFVIGDDFRDPVEIHIRDLPTVAASKASSFWIEGGEKIIRVWDGPIGEPGSNVLEWFTTEKLIWAVHAVTPVSSDSTATARPPPTIFSMSGSPRSETASTA